MITKVKIGCVNYLNTLPLIEGLTRSGMDSISVLLMTPKECFRSFREGDVDISLVPTGALHTLTDYKIFGGTCIGSTSNVYSVALFANSPIDEITTIYLDNHSTTSVALLQILMKNYYKQDVSYIDADVTDIELGDKDGVLMIGDKAFEGHKRYSHVYDLGKLWHDYTGLPFVYACWVAHPSVDSTILSAIDKALIQGAGTIEHVLTKANAMFPNIDAKKYFTEYIDYTFDEPKKEALERYQSLQKELNMTSSKIIE